MFDINTFSNKLKQYSEGIPEKFLSENTIKKLYTVCSELEEKSKLFNLTAITDPDEVLKKHIVDCLFLAAEIENWDKGSGKVLDVGSGAGFPSLPVAAALDDYSVTALDSTAKKIGYIKNTADLMGVTDFDAISLLKSVSTNPAV